jgi:hypothetical protein
MGDVTGIIKNIIANHNAAAAATQMPNIVVGSPRNNVINVVGSSGVAGGTTGASIERINKNISDSIKGSAIPHNKEIQLIQAYQHQKWKEQITQRSKTLIRSYCRCV